MKIGNYRLMVLLLNKCILIDGWNFPGVQFLTGNISFKPRLKKKYQNHAMEVGRMTYDIQPPGMLSSWISDAPGIMFSIQCKDLRSATRNSILEWPLNENTSEILHLGALFLMQFSVLPTVSLASWFLKSNWHTKLQMSVQKISVSSWFFVYQVGHASVPDPRSCTTPAWGKF